MNIRKNARLTAFGRERMAHLSAMGQTPQAIARTAGVCPRTVRKWLARFGPFVALAISLLMTDAALACSCRPRSPSDIAASSAAIFHGVALRSEAAGPGQSLTTFRVIEGIKGARAGQQIRIRHRSGSSASCGVRFAIGQDQALAAYGDNGALATSLCGVYPFRGREGLDLMQALRRLK